ncbi:hypothetical protein FACS1894126_1830 [Alphaproteobacteria bacterium]|nr:hypothetical protein FACS1894126_1830 [Alphaproteobacteria bacterium]
MCKKPDNSERQYALDLDLDDISEDDTGNEGELECLKAEYVKAKLETEKERCKFLEIRVQTALGKLIPADEVKSAMFAKGRIIRDGILNIPDRIAPLLINKSDASEIHGILMRELRDVLTELSRDEQDG